MLIEADYRGYRIEVTGIPVDGRFNAEVRIRKRMLERLAG